MNPNPVPPPVEHQFKPGQSGNPNGAPKGPYLTTILKKLLDEEIEIVDAETGLKRKIRKSELVTVALLKQAAKGNVKAIREIMDRIDGKVPQKIGLTGADGENLIPPQIIFAPISPRQDVTPPVNPPGQ
jgi:hypothetical protein